MLRKEIIILPGIVCISLLYSLAFATTCDIGEATIPAAGANWTLPASSARITCQNGTDATDVSKVCMTTDSEDGKKTTFSCGPYKTDKTAYDAANALTGNCTMTKTKNMCYCAITTANCNPWMKNTYSGAGSLSQVTGVAMTILMLTTSQII